MICSAFLWACVLRIVVATLSLLLLILLFINVIVQYDVGLQCFEGERIKKKMPVLIQIIKMHFHLTTTQYTHHAPIQLNIMLYHRHESIQICQRQQRYTIIPTTIEYETA